MKNGWGSFRRSVDDATSEVSVSQGANSVLRQRLAEQEKYIACLRCEVDGSRVQLADVIDHLQVKEEQSEQLFQVVQMLEQELRTTEAARSQSQLRVKHREQEVESIEEQLNEVLKDLDYHDSVLSAKGGGDIRSSQGAILVDTQGDRRG
eukprot:CAMPEP_0114253304 /NCGR_PEP_ID=MMETSP0058-20121206/16314_1 /TAXON_ID=36894 /ORGANISM="Pyramimonas parkeae, CCMP726" /LENGTH=149 /DNA_ID=CAMNT_0001367327 /DNA_START=138 /DNA_END=587 /DNA_ORIENTATION=-